MQEAYLEYILSDEKALLQPERILALLKETAWARHYTLDTIDGIIRNSLCMGAYAGGMQVGFARCVTDATTVFYLEDVVIHPEHRGCGLGTALVKTILAQEPICRLKGILVTDDAFSLYEPFGFVRDREIFMKKVSPLNGCF